MAGHLTLEERDRIAQLRHQHANRKEIARTLGRSPATIGRELRRNATGENYYAALGWQQESVRRRRERPSRGRWTIPKSTTPFAPDWPRIMGAGAESRAGWKTAGRRPFGFAANDLCLDPAGREDRKHWESMLRRARGKRRWPLEKHGSDGRRRPHSQSSGGHRGAAAAGEDFEGDTAPSGRPATGGLATLVCRKSRLTIVIKIQSTNADHVHDKLKQRLRELDEERRALDHV